MTIKKAILFKAQTILHNSSVTTQPPPRFAHSRSRTWSEDQESNTPSLPPKSIASNMYMWAFSCHGTDAQILSFLGSWWERWWELKLIVQNQKSCSKVLTLVTLQGERRWGGHCVATTWASSWSFCPESEVALSVSVELSHGEGVRARLGLFYS